MLDALFRRLLPPEEAEKRTPDLPHAVAALLVEAARSDEEYTDEERDMISVMLARRFGLSRDKAASLRASAEQSQDAANDLYGFTRVVKDQFDHAQKMSLIEDMWAIVLSDGVTDPHEEAIIRRLVGLIHLEDRDSAIARQQAAARDGSDA